MLRNRLFWPRKPRSKVKPFTLPSRWNAARLRLEALDDRVVPSFAEPTIYPIGPGAYSLAAADFTGDGILDLATTGAVLVGNGDGSFQPARLSPVTSGLTGDVDGDGKADLITATATASGTSLNVLISNGDGTFQPAGPVTLPPAMPPDYTGEPLAQSIGSAAVGDFNADGLLDLVVTGTTDHTFPDDPNSTGVRSTFANLLIGTGLGTFDHAGTHYLGGDLPGELPNEFFVGPDVGDFNGDGNLDFLTSYSIDYPWGNDYSGLHAWLGNGDGTFQSPQGTYSYTGTTFVQLAVADFNQDGKTDVLIGGEAYGTRTVALGNADGTFSPMDPFPIGQYEWAVVGKDVGDVNGDGKLDLVFVKKPSYEDGWADVLLGNGNGTFTAPVSYQLGSSAYASPTLADFDGDGLADLAAVDRNVGVIVHLNTGSSTPPPPQLRITGAAVIEGNSGTTNMTFTATLSHAATGPVTVQYATADGTATAGSDYQGASGTLTFAPGETERTVSIAVLGDRQYEPDEYIVINLSNPTGALIANSSGGGTILNDDRPLPSISISDVTKAEGRKGQKNQFVFTVTLSAAYDQPVTVSFRTADGTAQAGNGDYVATSGTLTFRPGETVKTVTITVKGDSQKEADETFTLNLSGATNAQILDGTGLGTILNDD